MSVNARSVALLAGLLAAAAIVAPSVARCSDPPRIAPWYRNLEGAVSLRFDDSYESHAAMVIPLLNSHGYRATFMVNPGLYRYRANKSFWEKEVPAMGHRLGNHTMKHGGAKNIREADSEIGEVTRLIRSLYPRESALDVFASGGGEKWGGKAWEQADPMYLQIAQKYHLIDLYDGRHPSDQVSGSSTVSGLCELVDDVMAKRRYQAFHFHDVGPRSVIEYLKTIVRGYNLSTSEEVFRGFLDCLDARRKQIWVAPIIDILKYEEEVRGASLEFKKATRNGYVLSLSVKTDPSLYDHPLTLILPPVEGKIARSVLQNHREHRAYQGAAGETLVDVEPVSGEITLVFDER